MAEGEDGQFRGLGRLGEQGISRAPAPGVVELCHRRLGILDPTIFAFILEF